MKLKERALSILLSLVMVLTFMPALAFAEGDEPADVDAASAIQEAEASLEAPEADLESRDAANAQSVRISYNLRTPETEGDDYWRFTWMEHDGNFNAATGDKLIIGETEYIYIEGEGFVAEGTNLDENSYWFEYFKDDEEVPLDNLTAGTYEVYIVFDNEDYDKTYVTDVTVTENPYESISYTPAKSWYLLSEINKYKESFDNWAAYYVPVQEGDKLIIKKKDEEAKEFIAKKYTFEGEEGPYEEVGFDLGDGSEENFEFWSGSLWYGSEAPIAGSDAGAVYNFELFFYGVSAVVPITVATMTPEEKAAREQAAALDAAFNGTPDGAVPAAKSVKAKAAKKSFTVSWKKATKKNLKKFDKVEIQYSQDPSFPRTATTVKEVKKTKKSLKVKKLAQKSVYYVRVRDIKYVGGVKYVSGWSKTKKVKVK